MLETRRRVFIAAIDTLSQRSTPDRGARDRYGPAGSVGVPPGRLPVCAINRAEQSLRDLLSEIAAGQAKLTPSTLWSPDTAQALGPRTKLGGCYHLADRAR